MATSTFEGPGISIRVERDEIEVTSNAPRRDPDWHYTDKEDHEHRLVDNDWPTLKWVIDETYWCEECRDEHHEGHWECRECGEEISPGMRGPKPVREFIPGPARYFVNDEEVTEEECRVIVEKFQT